MVFSDLNVGVKLNAKAPEISGDIQRLVSNIVEVLRDVTVVQCVGFSRLCGAHGQTQAWQSAAMPILL